MFSAYRYDEKALAERSVLFRTYHGVRYRLLSRVAQHSRLGKWLVGWEVPEEFAETVPALRPGGNPEPAAAPAPSSSSTVAAPVA